MIDTGWKRGYLSRINISERTEMDNLKKKKKKSGYDYQNLHINYSLDTQEPGETRINNWEFLEKVCIYLYALKSIFFSKFYANNFGYYVFEKR